MSPTPGPITWASIFKVLAAAVFVWAWLKLWPLVMVLAVALLLAVTLDPAIEWLCKRGIARWGAVAILGVLSVALSGFIVAVIVPPLVEQSTLVVGQLDTLKGDLRGHLPPFLWKMLKPILTGEPKRVGHPSHRRTDGRVDPALELVHVLGVQRQSRHELEAT